MTGIGRRIAIGGWVVEVVAARRKPAEERRDHAHERRYAALEATRCADADEGAHQQSQVEAANVDEEPLQDVRVAAQVRAPHRPGLVEMRVRTFQSLTALALQ